MAIAPLSDIVLDVAGAADPVRRQEATERLAKLAGAAPSAQPAFSDLLHSSAVLHPSMPVGVAMGSRLGPIDTRSASPNKVYQKFEAVFLQNFVEAMLPKDEELFGDAASADISRSMMAEQLAQQIAKTGKLGIASKIMAAHSATGSLHQAAVLSPGIPLSGVLPPIGLDHPGEPLDIRPIDERNSSI